jgi:hypothetical protein
MIEFLALPGDRPGADLGGGGGIGTGPSLEFVEYHILI